MTFQYPTWYLVFCALLGLAFAATLYYKDKTFRQQSVWLGRALAVLRWLSVTLLAVLLLSPLLKSVITEVKKPVVLIAQDHSESINMGLRDSAKYRNDIQNLAQALGNQYEIHTYSFGDNVREGANFAYKDKLTNISAVFKTAYDLYSTQNLGAIILATDGIYNEGSNPTYNAAKLNVPVFSIALGDTTPKKDVVVKRVLHNNIAYLGDKFNIQIDVTATNCSGANTPLSISRIDAAGNASTVQNAAISVDKNNFFATREVTLEASQAGVQRFRVAVGAINGEVSTANNVKEIFIEVLDARTKILLLANAPHPDIAALQSAISGNKNYDVKIGYVNDLKVNIQDFDFVVLHQVPSLSNGADAILNNLKSRRTPHLFIVGSQSDVRKVSAAQSLININANPQQLNDVQAIVNNGFNLFTLDNSLSGVAQFPPLSTPFGEFKELTGGQVLLYQRIGKVETKYPLLIMGEANGARVGVVSGEGIWKWRLFDFLQHQNHQLFDGLFSKIIQYLSVKEDKRKFRVTLEKNLYNENEPIYFVAELYNNSYELVNEPEARMVVTDGTGKQFNFNFNKNGKSYSLSAGVLAVGNYNYRASVTYAGQEYTAEGKFSVQPIQLELFETTADHSSLRAMALQSGGEVVGESEINKISELLKNKNAIKPIMYATNKTESVINLKWIFGLLVLLLSVEWFLRKYFGGY